MRASGSGVGTVAALKFAAHTGPLAAALALGGLLAFAACGGNDKGAPPAAGTTEQQAAAAEKTAETAASRSACDVLTAADASAILGQKLEARPDTEDVGPRHSSCGYYPASGESFGAFWMTVYWSGGQEEWNTWQMATSMAGKTWEQTEKVSLDSINKAGPVSGLGDRAYYGGLLPSLVLKGDVLLELKLAVIDNEEQNFPRLAKAALARLD